MTPYGPGLRQEIVRLALLGCALFPLRGDGSKRPAVKGWRESASSDPQTVLDWFHELESRNYPVCLGLATGQASGLFVIDGDTPEAVDWVTSRFAPDGPNVLTSRGGHFYFTMPRFATVKNSASRLYPKVDVRGTGGLVVVPPSSRKDGTPYTWVNPAFYQPSEELLSLVAPRESVVLPAMTPRTFSTPAREETWLARRIDIEVSKAMNAIGASTEGSRNQALYSNAFRLGSIARAVPSHYMTLQSSCSILCEVATARGLPRGEADRTTKTAFARGVELGGHPGFATQTTSGVVATESLALSRDELLEGL